MSEDDTVFESRRDSFVQPKVASPSTLRSTATEDGRATRGRQKKRSSTKTVRLQILKNRCGVKRRTILPPPEPGHLLSPSLSSIRNGGEGGCRPGEEALRVQGVKARSLASRNSPPDPLPLGEGIAVARRSIAQRVFAWRRLTVFQETGRGFSLSQRERAGVRESLQISGYLPAPLKML